MLIYKYANIRIFATFALNYHICIMTRIKRGKVRARKRKKILSYTKGFRWARKSKTRAAKEALLHAWSHSYVGRKKKKGDFRRAWQVQINAACRQYDLPYNKFIAGLKKNKIELDRKILADLAKNNPEVFRKIVESIKK